MIELSEVTKTFNAGKANAFTALKGINLSIDSPPERPGNDQPP
jgi:ABC-type methionine transport system ATPase subunit